MRQLVTENPNFVLGWRQLAAWYDAAGRHRDCLDATEHFVRLEPANPLAYVYRGEARRTSPTAAGRWPTSRRRSNSTRRSRRPG